MRILRLFLPFLFLDLINHAELLNLILNHALFVSACLFIINTRNEVKS